MATTPIKLFVNRQSGKLANFNGSVTQMPDLYQYTVVDFEISAVDPATNPTAGNPTLANLTGYGARVSIGAKPIGNTSVSPAAIQTTWTYDTVNNKFVGSINLAVAAIDTLIGGNDFVTAYFEIQLTLSGNRYVLLQTTFILHATVDEGTSSPPSPAISYPTWPEAQAQFVSRIMENGGTITIPSPNGVYALLLGCNDDGTARMDVITL